LTTLSTNTTNTCFFFNNTTTTKIYTLSLHDALPISKAESEFYVRPNGNIHSWCIACMKQLRVDRNPEIAAYQRRRRKNRSGAERSEEHTSELQSRENLVCRLLLEKKKKKKKHKNKQ